MEREYGVARKVKAVMGKVRDGIDETAEGYITKKIYDALDDASLTSIDAIAITKQGQIVIAIVVYETA